MGNMSYCMFENTFQDLEECYEALVKAGSVSELEEIVNRYELPYVEKLLSLCMDIAEEFGDEIK